MKLKTKDTLKNVAFWVTYIAIIYGLMELMLWISFEFVGFI